MELATSRNIVETLAQGVHPKTGEAFPPDSPYNDPDVIRALFSVLDAVKQAGRPNQPLEERRAENLERGRPRNAGLPWTDDERALVRSEYLSGMSVEKLAAKLQRSAAAIVAEVIRQDLATAHHR